MNLYTAIYAHTTGIARVSFRFNNLAKALVCTPELSARHQDLHPQTDIPGLSCLLQTPTDVRRPGTRCTHAPASTVLGIIRCACIFSRDFASTDAWQRASGGNLGIGGYGALTSVACHQHFNMHLVVSHLRYPHARAGGMIHVFGEGFPCRRQSF